MKNKHYQDFYKVFEQAILDAVKPKMILTLTGGWDTRVIAGVLVSNDVSLPTITWGDKLENIVACKVASILSLKHYSCSRSETFTVLKQFRENGYKYILVGSFFDEINGSWRGSIAKTYEQFEYTKRKYMQDAVKSVSKKDFYLEIIAPILDTNVLACLQKIPWQLRKGKQIQRWILKNKFPKLWHVIYYNSLMPAFLPFYLHAICNKVHKITWRRRFLESERPTI